MILSVTWTKVALNGLFLNPLNAELNPICYLLALLGAHHFLHVSRIRVKSLTLRLLMSYIQMYHKLRSLLRESVPYVKKYRYNPEHLCPKLNGYGDNGQRSLRL
jgi:transposase